MNRLPTRTPTTRARSRNVRRSSMVRYQSLERSRAAKLDETLQPIEVLHVEQRLIGFLMSGHDDFGIGAEFAAVESVGRPFPRGFRIDGFLAERTKHGMAPSPFHNVAHGSRFPDDMRKQKPRRR